MSSRKTPVKAQKTGSKVSNAKKRRGKPPPRSSHESLRFVASSATPSSGDTPQRPGSTTKKNSHTARTCIHLFMDKYRPCLPILGLIFVIKADAAKKRAENRPFFLSYFNFFTKIKVQVSCLSCNF